MRFINKQFPFAALASLLFLAACGGQPAATPPPAGGTINVTSATAVDHVNYVLTGNIELPSPGSASLEYSLNDSDWVEQSLSNLPDFSIPLTLREGENKISLALTTSADIRTQEDVVVTVTVTKGPRISLDSPTHSTTASYMLSGFVFEDAAITSVGYQLNDQPQVALTLTETGAFSVEIDLAPAENRIVVTASDAAGHSNSKTLMVTYDPQIAGVSATPMVAQRGEQVVLSGSNFGDAAGTVLMGGVEAEVETWSATEITVLVPRSGVNGWADISISSQVSSFDLPGFFVGLEILKADLTAAITAAEPSPGTALLLPGTDYFLTQATDQQVPANYLQAFSLYGAPTDGEPVTELRSTNGMLLLSTSHSFGVQLQDLVISTHSLHVRNRPAGQIWSLSDQATAGLGVRNVRFFSGAYSGISADSTFLVGDPSDLSNDHPGMSPQALQLDGVRIEGFDSVRTYVINASIRNSHVATGGLEISAVQGHLEITDSTLRTVPGFVSMLMGRLGTSIERSTVQASGFMVIGDLFLGPRAPIVIRDSVLELENPTTPAIVFAIGGKDSVIEGNTIELDLTFGSAGPDSRFSQNNVAAGTISLAATAGGELLVTDNEFALTDELTLIAELTGKLTFSENAILSAERARIEGPGRVEVSRNQFDFAGTSLTGASVYVYVFGSGQLELDFVNNHTTGSNRLFEFEVSAPTAELQATVTGNDFDAELTQLGDVAVLTGITSPSRITTSDNVWGNLTSAEEVLALIDLGGSPPEVFTVDPF